MMLVARGRPQTRASRTVRASMSSWASTLSAHLTLRSSPAEAPRAKTRTRQTRLIAAGSAQTS
eukprot:15479535-Alexandrium_andersonii.AAC.1